MDLKLTLTVTEVARQLNISRPKAYALANSKGFPSIRLGKRIVIPVEGLKAWLKKESAQY